jgi:ABC-type multidrug transport system ATPase subunit
MMGQPLNTHRNEILRQVGAVIEKPDLYKYLSGYENLSLFARLSGVNANRRVLMDQLEQVGLADRAKDKFRTYSQGMKQRLGIAVALIHNPALIILDEPTNGLDPQGIADMRRLILQLAREQGKTIVISSHLLYEIEQLATRMIIIHKGRKIVEGSVAGLLDPTKTLVRLEATEKEKARTLLGNSQWSAQLQQKIELQLIMNRAEVPALIHHCVSAGIELLSVNTSHTLENYFLSLTNQSEHAHIAAD